MITSFKSLLTVVVRNIYTYPPELIPIYFPGLLDCGISDHVVETDNINTFKSYLSLATNHVLYTRY